MASVTSLDGDMRKLRLEKYSPQVAKETREWIESVLGEPLAGGDLLDALKDGVALCRLANMAIPPPGVRFKQSAMPFVQMENISHFLRACQSPAIGLQPHDVFLTVDLFEKKDPAQVMQCISAFSRIANRREPSQFPSAIGFQSQGEIVSPQSTGLVGGGSYGNRLRGTSSASNNSPSWSRSSSIRSPERTGDMTSNGTNPNRTMSPGVSSWSRKVDEGSTSPAWNIAQYGYMGGASQGNMGVSFGGRRQITSAAPHVPSSADKDRRRREEDAESARQKEQLEELNYKKRMEKEAEEQRAQGEEEDRRAENKRRLDEEARHLADEQKRKWEEEERQWKQDEEERQREEQEAERKLRHEQQRPRVDSDTLLQGQRVDPSRVGDGAKPPGSTNKETERLAEHNRQVQAAMERERKYEIQRQERMKNQNHRIMTDHDISTRMVDENRPHAHDEAKLHNNEREDEEWRADERDFLRKAHAKHQYREDEPPLKAQRPLPEPQSTPVKPPRPEPQQAPVQPPRPLPEPSTINTMQAQAPRSSTRPLPDPFTYSSASPAARNTRDRASRPAESEQPSRTNYMDLPVGNNGTERSRMSQPALDEEPTRTTYSSTTPIAPNRTDKFLSSNPPPEEVKARTTYSSELGRFDSAAEADEEDNRRLASQKKTKAAGWASGSLLEREMELERERQREWAVAQKATAEAAKRGKPANTRDTYGNGTNGAGDKRPLVGPRPPPGK